VSRLSANKKAKKNVKAAVGTREVTCSGVEGKGGESRDLRDLREAVGDGGGEGRDLRAIGEALRGLWASLHAATALCQRNSSTLDQEESQVVKSVFPKPLAAKNTF
jgi:hypothetical protein